MHYKEVKSVGSSAPVQCGQPGVVHTVNENLPAIYALIIAGDTALLAACALSPGGS